MIDHELERERGRATIDAAKRAIQVPTLTGGIVTVYDPSTRVAQVKLDGDPFDAITPIVNLAAEPLHVNQRVQVLQYPPNGAAVIGSTSPSRCGISTKRTGTQAFSTGVEATITWQSNVYDTDGFMLTPGATLKVPVGLGSLFSFVVQMNPASALGFDYVKFTFSTLGTFYAPINSGTTGQTASIGPLPLLDSETIQVAARIAANVNATPAMWMHRIGA